VRQVAALLLFVVGACGDGDRQGLTADSAVLQPGGTGSDSTTGRVGSQGTAVDSPSGDTLTVDSIALHNPTMVLVSDSVAGEELFRRKGKCLSCHGQAGRGTGLGPNLQDSVWLHGDGSFAFIRRTIRDGIARPKESNLVMPAFGRAPGADASLLSTTLAPEEIYRVAAYVYALSHPGSVVMDTTTAAPDSGLARPDSVPPVPPPVAAPASSIDSRSDTPFIR
jgi:mono/diheme cytochrome c family protein